MSLSIQKSISDFIEKYKIYLQMGEKPPKGYQIQRGRQGGVFYDTDAKRVEEQRPVITKPKREYIEDERMGIKSNFPYFNMAKFPSSIIIDKFKKQNESILKKYKLDNRSNIAGKMYDFITRNISDKPLLMQNGKIKGILDAAIVDNGKTMHLRNIAISPEDVFKSPQEVNKIKLFGLYKTAKEANDRGCKTIEVDVLNSEKYLYKRLGFEDKKLFRSPDEGTAHGNAMVINKTEYEDNIKHIINRLETDKGIFNPKKKSKIKVEPQNTEKVKKYNKNDVNNLVNEWKKAKIESDKEAYKAQTSVEMTRSVKEQKAIRAREAKYYNKWQNLDNKMKDFKNIHGIDIKTAWEKINNRKWPVGNKQSVSKPVQEEPKLESINKPQENIGPKPMIYHTPQGGVTVLGKTKNGYKVKFLDGKLKGQIKSDIPINFNQQ